MTIGIEVLLRHIPNHYMIKSNFIDKESDKIKILILGSSHGITGIDPQYLSKPAYNTANYAQSFDNDFEILNKYKDQLDSLEYILLPVSYHSLWYKLEIHDQKWRMKYYNTYYGVKVESNPIKRLFFLDQTIKKDLEIIKSYYWDKEPVDLTLSPYGLSITPPQTSLEWLNSNIDKVIKAHSTPDLNRLYDENVSYLQAIIDIAKEKNVKVIFFTMPTHQIFAERLHSEQLSLLYETMDSLTDNKSVFYYNFLYDFTKEDQVTSLKYFCDADHLSYIGAEVFTQKLDSVVKTIDKRK